MQASDAKSERKISLKTINIKIVIGTSSVHKVSIGKVVPEAVCLQTITQIYIIFGILKNKTNKKNIFICPF